MEDGIFQVRLHDPNGKRSVIWTEGKSTDGIFASISTISTKKSGVPLVSLSLPVEVCGATSLTHYYQYANTPKQQLHKSISESVFSDSPAYHEESVVWNSDKTIIYNVDSSGYTSTQKYCLNGFQYQACGKKTEIYKEGEDY